MTVWPVPSSAIVRPTIDGSAPKRRSQTPWLSSATFAAPGSPSSGEKLRPSSGCKPKTVNRLAVEYAPPRRAGSSASVSVNDVPV